MITSEKAFLKGFQDCFSEVKEFRKRRSRIEYPLIEVLFLSVVAIGVGAESWEDIELLGEQNIEVLRQYLPYLNGTPSDDTIRIIMSGISKTELNGALYKYFRPSLKLGESIAIDGKTLCASRTGADSALHLVSAFATSSSITFSQIATKGKGNEINAIYELLELIDIEGHIVTIDAIGTQKKIVNRIVEKGGDYIIALKRNQVALFNQACEMLNLAKARYQNYSVHSTIETAHGRTEERICTVVQDVNYLFGAAEWSNLRSVVKVEYKSDKGGSTQSYTRYFISSCNKTAEDMLLAIRDHWKIENTSHWVLDVVLNEDRSRINKDNGPAYEKTIHDLSKMPGMENIKDPIGQGRYVKYPDGIKTHGYEIGTAHNSVRIVQAKPGSEFASHHVDYSVVKVNGTCVDKHGNYIKQNKGGIFIEDRATGKQTYITDSEGRFLEEEYKHLKAARELDETPHAHIPLIDYMKMEGIWKPKR